MYPHQPTPQPEPQVDKAKLALGGLVAVGGLASLGDAGFISAEWARVLMILFGIGSLVYAGILVYSGLGYGPAQPQTAQ